MTTTHYASPRPTRAQLVQQVGAVLADVPRFLTAPLYRRWHRHWGASPAETAARMPGDGRLPHATYRCTRAITIEAPPHAVWPWLVQAGCLKAGFYSDDLLDNLTRPSADEIVPTLQVLQEGQWVPMSPRPSERTAFKVTSFAQPRWMLWSKPDSTWAWRLQELGGGRTRLVTRVRAEYDWSRPASAVVSVVLMEFGDFAMMRRMMLGIKSRAEATTHPRRRRR